MDSSKIQARVDALAARMLDKGLVQPNAQFHLEANRQPCVFLMWAQNSTYGIRDQSELMRGDDAEEALSKAEAWVLSLPSKQEAQLQQFMAAVATAIEIGRANGISETFVNPLSEMAKRLSENALPYQGASIGKPEGDDEQ